MNPLLAPWAGPCGGLPPFDRVRPEHLGPALEAAMAGELAAAERVASDPAPPDFENTLAALERAARPLEGVRRLFEVYTWALATAEVQALERELAPRLAAHRSRLTQDPRLFARVDAVHQDLAGTCRTPEQRRLAWLVHGDMVRAGARLEPAARARVGAIDERIATLQTTFAQNLLSDEQARPLLLGEDDLTGLPEALRAAMAEAARSAGHAGRWAVLNTRSSVEPFLSHSHRRDLREKVWRAFLRRGDNGDAWDNKPVVAELLRLRAERARLLGHPSHAHLRLENRMARTPERALALLEQVWTVAVARAREEVAELQALADREGAGLAIAPWDHRYYAERVRRERFQVDEAEVRPYLQLERLREGMFWVAGRLFGLSFQPLPEAPVYHPDVRAFQAVDRAGSPVGLIYFDPFARPGKASGAWMAQVRSQERLDGPVLPVVTNCANLVKAPPGEPTLLGWDDASMLFHEFGHALHGLLSQVELPALSGTSVALDYVEFPSQILERWLQVPEVLQRFAVHAGTGAPIPAALVGRLVAAARYNQGFAVVEYLASALVDMKLHLSGGEVDPAAFERQALAELGMPGEIAMRHRLPQFGHLFSRDDYSAGYYAYLWAETLSADGYAAFAEAGDPFDAGVSARLGRLLSLGNTVDPAEAYRGFRGRDPGVEPYLRWRGLA